MRRPALPSLCTAVLALAGLGFAPAHAGQASASFQVSVQLQGGQSFGGSGPCGATAGAQAIVLGCGPAVVPVQPPAPPVTPTPAPGQPETPPPATMPPDTPPASVPPAAVPPAPTHPMPTPAAAVPLRMLAFVPRETGPALATIDLYTGTGTITAWRVVRYGEREYLEMTLGW